MYRRILSAFVVACAAVIVSNAVSAQDFPNRAITIIVPQPPGGGTDIISRIVAQQLVGAQHQLGAGGIGEVAEHHHATIAFLPPGNHRDPVSAGTRLRVSFPRDDVPRTRT